MSLKKGIGGVEYMKKRIPTNTKYQHVKTKLDTGCSLTKYMEKLAEIEKNYRYRKDEIFKRLKVTTFAQLILQVTSVSDMDESEDGESHAPEDAVSVVDLECLSERTNGSLPSDRQEAGEGRDAVCHSARSTLLSVVHGVGELNLEKSGQKEEVAVCPRPPDRPYPDCPYLLLDVRERDQYDRCHIISAHSFPTAMLTRTMNPYTRDVLAYKNAAGRIIIVYDEDERLASLAATSMCERGFENLFMLSGGLKVIAQKFPEGMTTGSIPTSCLSSPTASRRKKSSVAPQAAERRCRFTADELCKIQEQMEEILIPSNANSRMSSRMSSSNSKTPGAPSRQSCLATGRDSGRIQSSRPWK